MTVTSQTNTTLSEIASALAERDHFVIGGHVSPDGDCLGSALGLAWALRQLGKQVTCVLARDEEPPSDLMFLPGADGLVPAARFEGPCECFIAVDVPTPERLGDGARLHEAAPFTVTVDHHAVPRAMSDLSYTDPDAASTSLLIWELAALLGADRERIVATCCYTGLMTDTGRFQHGNTDAVAFKGACEMVAAGARPGEIAREFYQNRSLASIELEGRTVSHMCLSGDGRGGALVALARRFRRVRCREGRCRAHDRSSALLARRARCLHAAGAGRRGARQLPFQGRHRRGRHRRRVRRRRT